MPFMTLLWFIIWLVANIVGGNEPLTLDPVNAWMGTLILAVALDLAASHAGAARTTSQNEATGSSSTDPAAADRQPLSS